VYDRNRKKLRPSCWDGAILKEFIGKVACFEDMNYQNQTTEHVMCM